MRTRQSRRARTWAEQGLTEPLGWVEIQTDLVQDVIVSVWTRNDWHILVLDEAVNIAA